MISTLITLAYAAGLPVAVVTAVVHARAKSRAQKLAETETLVLKQLAADSGVQESTLQRTLPLRSTYEVRQALENLQLRGAVIAYFKGGQVFYVLPELYWEIEE